MRQGLNESTELNIKLAFYKSALTYLRDRSYSNLVQFLDNINLMLFLFDIKKIEYEVTPIESNEIEYDIKLLLKDLDNFTLDKAILLIRYIYTLELVNTKQK